MEKLDKLNDILGKLTAEQKWTSEIKQSILTEFKNLYRERHVFEDRDTKDTPGDSNPETITSPEGIVSERAYKLDPTTPKYHGRRDEDVESWIFKIHSALKMARIPEKYKLAAITSFVEGHAFTLLMKYHTDTSENTRNIQDFFFKFLRIQATRCHVETKF